MLELLLAVVASLDSTRDPLPWDLVTVAGIFAWVPLVLQLIGHAVSVSVKFLVNKLAWIAVQTWKGIRVVGLALKDSVLAVYRGLRELWSDVIRPALDALRGWISDAAAFLRRIFGPIYEVLSKLVRALDWVYLRILRPLFKYLDAIGAVLRLLGALGVEWARKLDDKLYRLRLEIWSAFEEARRTINGVRDVMRLLVDPRGFLLRAPFLWSVYAHGLDVWAVLVNFGVKAPLGGPGPALPPAPPYSRVVEPLASGELFREPRFVDAIARLNRRLGPS